MALNKNQLSKVSNLNSVTSATASRQIWHYDAGADSVATAVAAGYFNDVRGFLFVGDVIHLVAAGGTAFRVLTVTAVPKIGSNVTVSAAAFS